MISVQMTAYKNGVPYPVKILAFTGQKEEHSILLPRYEALQSADQDPYWNITWKQRFLVGGFWQVNSVQWPVGWESGLSFGHYSSSCSSVIGDVGISSLH